MQEGSRHASLWKGRQRRFHVHIRARAPRVLVSGGDLGAPWSVEAVTLRGGDHVHASPFPASPQPRLALDVAWSDCKQTAARV